ncbi:site-specific integrase [Dactylosporangium sp. CA-139066]|uniref:site-specific integrase n=1 Tax=Dactylosporangium sp. CA-139066 TaxID=3239930 RepID=UPI003D94E518
MRWQAVDLERRQLSITSPNPPPAAARSPWTGRTVTILHMRQHRQRQLCRAAGRPWRESGYVFTRPDGQPFHPNSLTKRLRYLITAAGLPPVRLHDLRHGTASLAHTAGADLKTVQDQLGHASIVLTADTYTSVLPATQHKAVKPDADGVKRSKRRKQQRAANKHPGPHRTARQEETAGQMVGRQGLEP